MNDVAENENKKAKETKETSEAESYEDYENEAMEDSGEGSEMGEGAVAASSLFSGACPSPSGVSDDKEDRAAKERNLSDLYEEKRENLIREKWLTVTGRKPRDFPNMKRFRSEEDYDQLVLFGDKRPTEVEKKRIEKWTRQAAVAQSLLKPSRSFGNVKREIRLPGDYQSLLCVSFETNARSMATAFRNGGVQVRRAFTGEITANLNTSESFENLQVRSLRYHPINSDRLFLGGSTKKIQVFDTEAGELVANIDQEDQINNLDINSDGHYLATVGKDGIVSIHDATTLQRISIKSRPKITDTTQYTIEDDYHKLQIFGLKFHPINRNLFVTGGWDNTVKVWDVRTAVAILSIRGPFICGDSIDIRDDMILTGSWRVSESIQLWDFSSGKLFKTIPIKTKATHYEGEFLYAAKFLTKGVNEGSAYSKLIAVGGGGFLEVAIINVDTEKIVARFPSYKSVLTLDTYSNYVAYGGTESLFRIGEIVLYSPVSKLV